MDLMMSTNQKEALIMGLLKGAIDNETVVLSIGNKDFSFKISYCNHEIEAGGILSYYTFKLTGFKEKEIDFNE
jgi:hypothetical protein